MYVCVFGGKREIKGFFCVLYFVVGGRIGWGFLFSLLVLFSIGTNLQYMDHS